MLKVSKVKNFILKYRCQHKTDLLHVLDLICAKELENTDIARELVELFKQDKIVFAHEGTHIPYNPSKWTQKQWEESKIKGTLYNSFLRSLYAQGFKKSELTLLRDIMQRISEMTKGNVRPEWGFFRVKHGGCEK